MTVNSSINSIIPGSHLLIDFWDVQNITDIDLIKDVMLQAAAACDAKILEVKLHEFGSNFGITGVAILAESHITIHTWPEINYVALDIFLCGLRDPKKSLPIFRSAFKPQQEKITEIERGKN